ncbi:MAG: REP-associated tyrosine transposase [Candidatus Angelobacter sp.]
MLSADAIARIAAGTRHDFGLFGYVVMPEHIHLLISEPNVGNPSKVMAVLKQCVPRALRAKKRKTHRTQMRLWDEPWLGRYARFWQRRFYDFNVWSVKKKNEKMNYIHFNPVKRGLAASPKDWAWSSYNFYLRGEKGCAHRIPPGNARRGGAKKTPHPLQNAQRVRHPRI